VFKPGAKAAKIVPLISLQACYIIHESNEITSFLSYLPTVAFIASFYSFILAPPGRDAGQIFLEGSIKGCAKAALIELKQFGNAYNFDPTIAK